MADAPDSKSGDGNIVWVQVPSPAVKPLAFARGFFAIGNYIKKSYTPC